MNYAEDRLDRRARFLDCSQQEGLWADFTSSLSIIVRTTEENDDSISSLSEAHEHLGRCLRDVGWNRHAVYHFAVAWMLSDNNNTTSSSVNMDDSARRAGDYAQMAELAGFPEVGALALFYFFQTTAANNFCSLKVPSKQLHSDEKCQELDSSWLQQSTAPEGHCGCGSDDCGSHECFLPMGIDQLDPILEALEKYLLLQERSNNDATYSESVPSANTILGIMAKNALDQGRRRRRPLVNHHSFIPEQLAFWRGGMTHPVLQLLLLKLLYQCVPTLCATFMVELQSHLGDKGGRYQQELSVSHKSHWAYYVLIRSVILGERIKPHRRWTIPAYHIPVWDVLWGTDTNISPPLVVASSNNSNGITVDNDEDDRTGQDHSDNSRCGHDDDAHQWLQRLRQSLNYVSTRKNDVDQWQNTVVPLSWTLAPSNGPLQHVKPLFVIGDSHVLSLAWQILSLHPLDATQPKQRRRFVPIVITGLKAFHVRSETRFFTNSNLHTSLQRLQSYFRNNNNSGCTVLFSAGEIDCREGIGGPELLEGYRSVDMDQLQILVEHNVREYISSLQILFQRYPFLQQILVMPVAPHAQRTGGKVVGRGVRRQITHMWNDSLRKVMMDTTTTTTSSNGIYLLDYEVALRQADPTSPVGYVLNPYYNADHTHLNAAFLPLLQRAIEECGCDTSLI